MRGKHCDAANCTDDCRITPAGAGKTNCNQICDRKLRDHPRRCGENAYLPNRKIEPDGSPPQVRGKPPPCARCLRPKRITPAGAGKTLRRTHLFNVQWDHPRRCGENRDELYVGCPQGGSPPQVRGKLFLCWRTSRTCGITPAGAGKTPHPIRSLRSLQDHPRRCGENPMRATAAANDAGSPPQVRGKLLNKRHCGCKIRITPAGAGKTSQINRTVMLSWDHPRRCGENIVHVAHVHAGGGSPPQVRGKHKEAQNELFWTRITPAGAGKTKCIDAPPARW